MSHTNKIANKKKLLMKVDPMTLTKSRGNIRHDDVVSDSIVIDTQLEYSVKEHGVLYPPMVNNKFEVIDGFRRVQKAIENKEKEIEVIFIEDDLTLEEEYLISSHSRTGMLDFTDNDKLTVAKELLKESTVTTSIDDEKDREALISKISITLDMDYEKVNKLFPRENHDELHMTYQKPIRPNTLAYSKPIKPHYNETVKQNYLNSYNSIIDSVLKNKTRAIHKEFAKDLEKSGVTKGYKIQISDEIELLLKTRLAQTGYNIETLVPALLKLWAQYKISHIEPSLIE